MTSETALWFMDTRVSIVVPAASGEDRLSVIKHWAPYGNSPPLHIHDTEDEVFHVLEGQVQFNVDGATVTVTAGQTIMAPKGIPHSYLVVSEGGAKWLTMTSPGDFEGLVRALSRPATAAGLPDPHGPPSAEAAEHLMKVCAAHNIRMVGAPMRLAEAA